MKKIILIGGAPATGKSTLARELSNKLNCPWISTDFIRSWMKTIVSKKDYPNLFKFTNITAEEHYKKYSVQATLDFEDHRDREVFDGVKKFILKNNEWELFIIEGISIHPEFIPELKSNEFDIRPIFLIDNNKNRIREILFTRGLWGPANTYEDWVKEIEQEYLIKINSIIQNKCKELKLKYFVIKDDRKDTIGEILSLLLKNLTEKRKGRIKPPKDKKYRTG